MTARKALLAAAAILLAAGLTARTAPAGPTECRAFVNTLTERSKAVSKAEEAVQKLRPAPANCKLAKDLADTAAKIQSFINERKAACADVPPSDLSITLLKFETSTSELNNNAAQAQVERLCR
jgi:hypothetical protein